MRAKLAATTEDKQDNPLLADPQRLLQVTCGEAYSALRGWRPIPAAPLFPHSASRIVGKQAWYRRHSFHHRQRNTPLPNRMSIGIYRNSVKSIRLQDCG